MDSKAQVNEESLDKHSASEEEQEEEEDPAERRIFKISVPGNTELKFKLSFVSRVCI